ncbi:MAG: ATP-binding protein [Bacteroidota bacterium]
MQKRQIEDYMLLIFYLTVSPVCNFLFAQSYLNEVGTFPIQNFYSKEYGGRSQVFGVTRDTNNIVYFTGDGVVEFDGKEWKNTSCSDQLMTAIATGKDQRVYVGGTDELGYLSPDSLGNNVFTSLLPLLPEGQKIFGEIRRILPTEKSILFASKSTVLRYNFYDEKLSPINFDKRVTLLNHINDTTYIHLEGEGIRYITNDGHNATRLGKHFEDVRVVGLMRFHSDKLLACTKSQGLYLIGKNKVDNFNTEADSLLTQRILFGNKLDDDKYLFSSINNGIIVINNKGKLLHHITKESGIADDIILGCHHNDKGDLWLATNEGLSQLNISSSAAKFTFDSRGIFISAEDINRLGLQFYVASGNMNGLLYYNHNSSSFEPLVNSPFDQFFGFLNINENAYGIGGTGKGGTGIYRISGKSISPIYKDTTTRSYVMSGHQSKLNKSFVFLGLSDGFAGLKENNDGWQYIGRLDGFPIDLDVRAFKEVNSGELWIETYDQGLWKINYQLSITDGSVRVANVESFTASAAGNKFTDINTIHLHGDLLFSGTGGVYQYDSQTNELGIIENFIFPIPTSTIKRCILSERNDKEIYTYFLTKEGEPHFGIFTKNQNGQYTFSDSLFQKIPTEELLNIYKIYPDSNNIVWLGGQDGLLRYDHSVEESYVLPPVCFREISIGKDSIIYLGHGAINTSEIAHENNSLQFEYIIPNVSVNHTASYQYRLLGYDDAWSDWTTKTERTYTNLSEGSYTFQVRGKTRYASTDEVAAYSFTILPPWWRTWWAYAIYGIAVVSGLLWFSNWRNKQLRRKSEQLKNLVNQKTKQLANRIEELSAINSIQKDLVAQNDEDTICTLVGDKVQELFHANQAYISIKNASTEELYLPYSYRLSDEEKEREISSSIVETEGFQQREKSGNYNVKLPIKSGQENIGVLGLKNEAELDEDDWNLLHNITNQLGTALHNIYLFKAAEEARIIAEEANEAKSTFLSTVSHELRTPLTSIIGFAKIIKKRFEGRILPFVQIEERKTEKAIKQVSENLDVVVSEGERLTTLINSVLDLAKIEAGCLEWNLENTDIDTVIIQATAATSALFDSKPVELILDIEDQLPSINIDKDRIIQVLINLISNAVKFTDEGQISISAKERKNSIEVSVKDSGIGIAQDDISKVFDKFKQVGNTLTDKPKGTGLGLPICKEIIEYHEGQLWAESAIGEGSTFYFSVPCVRSSNEEQEEHMEAEEKIIPKAAIDSSESYILIVDDEVSIRSLMRQEISEFDYQIREASNGIEALELMKQQKPALIISDIVMPKMNGIELIKTIKADDDYKNIPILVVSITDGTQQLFDLGISQHLTKPIDIGRLMEEIKILLPSPQLVS